MLLQMLPMASRPPFFTAVAFLILGIEPNSTRITAFQTVCGQFFGPMVAQFQQAGSLQPNTPGAAELEKRLVDNFSLTTMQSHGRVMERFFTAVAAQNSTMLSAAVVRLGTCKHVLGWLQA